MASQKWDVMVKIFTIGDSGKHSRPAYSFVLAGVRNTALHVVLSVIFKAHTSALVLYWNPTTNSCGEDVAVAALRE
jgi:hypothetical protein